MMGKLWEGKSGEGKGGEYLGIKHVGHIVTILVRPIECILQRRVCVIGGC